MTRINWDHNATTPLHPEVAALLARAYAPGAPPLGNASSIHASGREARRRLQAARGSVAASLGCELREVYFTASGTEADAMALKGTFEARAEPARRRIVASAIEHPALLFALEQLRGRGADIQLVPPDSSGAVSPSAIVAALTEDTLLCSVMWANNETGVLQPVGELARACRARGILFHTDAVQAVGKVPVNLRETDADLLSISAHKFGGPPGAGVLVARRGIPLQPLVPGHQEGGYRGGTLEVPRFEALALALTLAEDACRSKAASLARLRDAFEREVRAALPDVEINGSAPRVANTSNLLFPGLDGEALLIALDLDGIAASSGAACASGSLRPSHVLTAMGRSAAAARSSLRFSLGVGATAAEVSAVRAALVAHVLRLRGETSSHGS